MAVKKTTQAAEAAKNEQTVKDTIELTKPDSDADEKTAERTEKAADQQGKAEELTLVYIGPSLPAGKLKSNRIFIGTEKQIEKELEAVMKEYPLVKKLLVPVDKVAEKKARARTTGNILNKYYSNLISGVAANEMKEG